MTAAIEVSHLSKSYGSSIAVSDISFSVAVGEVFCLLGPNGAGKTTTTEILEGYRQRSGGRVSVLGFDPATGGRAFRERIGIVLQECGVQDDLTVAEVIDMYASYAPRRMRTDDVVELVELDAKVTDRVRHLSGGQRRRLDVALAVVGLPEVIFLDEPTTGFDPAARRHSWAMIRSLCELGTTVLLTTHFMDEAQALADRIAVIAGGEVVAEGTPEGLGGRDRAQTTIAATIPRGTAPLPAFGALPTAIEQSSDGEEQLLLHCPAADTTSVLHQLTGWALDSGVELGSLSVTRPTLEDVYLALTQDRPDTRSIPTTNEGQEALR
ncbi:MAG: ABC transporter ATP-binding protein [Actinobacteria bacterium]|nr:ABC transporter ATP-binding protein [Actinomycetota bacterium]